ncbi:MAG TPA: SRPBCC domain-containing protein, partial [Terriglobales bacterium]|nr:SRPBCC domain-containing protein [Terriglobales bacterium]
MPTPVEIEGLIPAPAAQLFQAWTEPALIARWWPHAATVDRCVSEPRPGGEFVLLLRAADQQLYGFE